MTEPQRATDRYQGQLNEKDLKRFLKLAQDELHRFYSISNGKYAVYRDRLTAVCLCQGAAQHFRDDSFGVKDIDVFFFFRRASEDQDSSTRESSKTDLG